MVFVFFESLMAGIHVEKYVSDVNGQGTVNRTGGQVRRTAVDMWNGFGFLEFCVPGIDNGQTFADKGSFVLKIVFSGSGVTVCSPNNPGEVGNAEVIGQRRCEGLLTLGFGSA